MQLPCPSPSAAEPSPPEGPASRATWRLLTMAGQGGLLEPTKSFQGGPDLQLFGVFVRTTRKQAGVRRVSGTLVEDDCAEIIPRSRLRG